MNRISKKFALLFIKRAIKNPSSLYAFYNRKIWSLLPDSKNLLMVENGLPIRSYSLTNSLFRIYEFI